MITFPLYRSTGRQSNVWAPRNSRKVTHYVILNLLLGFGHRPPNRDKILYKAPTPVSFFFIVNIPMQYKVIF